MNLFHRHQEEREEEIEPIAKPPAAAEAVAKPDPIKPIQINDENYVLLLKALRPKEEIGRVLKDLNVDAARAKAVMGGMGRPSSANPSILSSHESPGPIV